MDNQNDDDRELDCPRCGGVGNMPMVDYDYEFTSNAPRPVYTSMKCPMCHGTGRA